MEQSGLQVFGLIKRLIIHILFQLKPGSTKWVELVVPEINDAERGSFLYQFKTGEICLGTNGKGAVLSEDNGLSWEKLNLAPDISTINYISELPDGKRLIFGRRLDVKYGQVPKDKPQSVIFISEDNEKNWDVLSEHTGNITSFIRHSSGRLVIGTDSIYGDGGLFFSEDGGTSWVKAKTDKEMTLLGIGGITESNNGNLLAGTLDGKSWKNTYIGDREFLKGGRILKSENGGKEWSLWAGDESWGNVKGILQLNESSFISNEGGNLIWSINNGSSWFHFGRSSSHWVNNIIEYDSKIVLFGNSAIVESPKNKLIINYIKKEN